MEESYHHGFWGVTSEEILRNKFPLHRACRDGDVEALSLLLVEAQHGIYVEDSFYGWSPAHWAAYFGKLGCLMKLMENNANCDCASKRLSQTSVHLAAFAGNSHCLKWLLHCGASKDKQDYLGETPVHKAARTGSMECVSLLASHGARFYIKNKNGLTPAQVAATCGHVECSAIIENTATRQEASMPMGVYQSQPAAGIATQPSLHDVTAKVHPCVITSGINGGRIPPPNPFHAVPSGIPAVQPSLLNGHLNDAGHGRGDSELCEMVDMEEESQEQCFNGTRNGFHLNQGVHMLGNGDVTVQKGVSANRIPVAGKKRCREESDDIEHKRLRTNGDTHVTNGYHSNHSPLLDSRLAAALAMKRADSASLAPHCPQTRVNGHALSAVLNEYAMSDTALEHCSTVLLELGYGDMVTAANVDCFHGS